MFGLITFMHLHKYNGIFVCEYVINIFKNFNNKIFFTQIHDILLSEKNQIFQIATQLKYQYYDLIYTKLCVWVFKVCVCVCVCVNRGNCLQDCCQNLNGDYLCIIELHLNFTFSFILLLWLKFLTMNPCYCYNEKSNAIFILGKEEIRGSCFSKRWSPVVGLGVTLTRRACYWVGTLRRERTGARSAGPL